MKIFHRKIFELRKAASLNYASNRILHGVLYETSDTGYGQDGPGIESRWGARFSAPVQTVPGAHPAPSKMGTRSIRGKGRPRRDADPSPTSTAVGHERVESYTSTLPMGRTACTEPQCLYKGNLYLFLQATDKLNFLYYFLIYSSFNDALIHSVYKC